MSRYRIVKVPIQGKPEKYRVEIRTIKLLPWWAARRSMGEWCRLDMRGRIWYSRSHRHGPSPPQLDLFDSVDEAKEYIRDRIEYLSKSNEVVFDTLTANPPKETGT